MIRVSRSSFRMVKQHDLDPDLSYLGEYSNYPKGKWTVDRKVSGEMGRGEYRYFNATRAEDRTQANADYNRMEAYNRGDWGCVGIKAVVDLHIPSGAGGHYVQRLESAGLWGIESDSGEGYFAEVYAEQCNELEGMLEELGKGIEIVDEVGPAISSKRFGNEPYEHETE